MGQYIRYAVVSIEEVLPLIKLNWGARRGKAILSTGHKVGVSSLRLMTFQRDATEHGICCAACGLKAEYFAVEGFTGSVLPSEHINLYGTKDGEDILFTHDHIIPKSDGGKDNLSNTQVMCQPCNSRKKSRNDSEFKAEMREMKC